MRPPLVSSTPSISASGLARTPAAHTTTPAGITVPSARWTSRRLPSVVIRSTPTPVRTSTPRRDNVRRARSLDLVGHRPEQPRRRLDEDDPRRPHVDVREVLGEHPGEQLHHRPRRLDAGRPAAAQDDVELAAVDDGRVGGRPLEPLQHGEAKVEGVVEVLQRDGVLVDAVDPVRRRHGAGGDDQRVVAQLVDDAVAAVEGHRLGVDVDAGDHRHVHRDVALAAEHAAHGVGDVVGVEPGGGDLVQQRLEQVEVVGVDDLDVDRRLGQSLGGGQTAEPGADHHHPVTVMNSLTVFTVRRPTPPPP